MTAKIPTEMIKKVSTVCICIGLCAMLNVLSLLLSLVFQLVSGVCLGRMGRPEGKACVCVCVCLWCCSFHHTITEFVVA